MGRIGGWPTVVLYGWYVGTAMLALLAFMPADWAGFLGRWQSLIGGMLTIVGALIGAGALFWLQGADRRQRRDGIAIFVSATLDMLARALRDLENIAGELEGLEPDRETLRPEEAVRRLEQISLAARNRLLEDHADLILLGSEVVRRLVTFRSRLDLTEGWSRQLAETLRNGRTWSTYFNFIYHCEDDAREARKLNELVRQTVPTAFPTTTARQLPGSSRVG